LITDNKLILLSKVKLIEVVNNLEKFDKESTIYASLPWNENSDAIVTQETSQGLAPNEINKAGLKYFIEVFIAIDFLEDWLSSLSSQPSEKEKCKRLIDYAINDA